MNARLLEKHIGETTPHRRLHQPKPPGLLLAALNLAAWCGAGFIAYVFYVAFCGGGT